MSELTKKIYNAMELGQDYYKSVTILLAEYQIRDALYLIPRVISQYLYAYELAITGKEQTIKSIRKTAKADDVIKKAEFVIKNVQNINTVISKKNIETIKKERILGDIISDIEYIENQAHKLITKKYPKEMPMLLQFIFHLFKPIYNLLKRQLIQLVERYFPEKRAKQIRIMIIGILSIFSVWWVCSGLYLWYYSEYRGLSKPGLYGIYYRTASPEKGYLYASCVDSYFDFGDWSNNVLVKNNKKETGIIWSGFFIAPIDGEYTFYINVDNYMRAYIDDIEVINIKEWTFLGDGNAIRVTVNMNTGKHPIKIVYGDWGGGRNLCIKVQEPNSKVNRVLDSHYLVTK